MTVQSRAPNKNSQQASISAGGKQEVSAGTKSNTDQQPNVQQTASIQARLAQANNQPPPPIPAPPSAQENLNDAAGRRVRLRFKPGAGITNGIGSLNGLMGPLKDTKGMIFPYQPTITYSQDVTYTNLEIVHANQDFYSYSKTPALKLTVEGDFSVQNQTEGQYALACIHFLRTVSKMDFGYGPNAGQPPPVLLFDAYGQYIFNALPVILTQFSVTLPKDVDYVGVSVGQNNISPQTSNPTITATTFDSINQNQLTGSFGGSNGGYAWLPALFSISVQLTVQNTPQRLRAFDLNKFRTGELLTQGTWV